MHVSSHLSRVGRTSGEWGVTSGTWLGGGWADGGHGTDGWEPIGVACPGGGSQRTTWMSGDRTGRMDGAMA